MKQKKSTFITAFFGVFLVIILILSIHFAKDFLRLYPRIMVNHMVYQQREEPVDALPQGYVEMGMLESVLAREKGNPTKNFQGVNLDEKYTGNRLYMSDVIFNTIYLEDDTGKYIPFVRVYDDENGFDMTDYEVARLLGYSSAYCYATYELEGGDYLIGFLAGDEEAHSDLGAVLFQFKNGQYELLSKVIHPGKALDPNAIALGVLSAPGGESYDVIQSNHSNLAKIRRLSGTEVLEEKVDDDQPSMTVLKASLASPEVIYTFHDPEGQEIERIHHGGK